jgi:hypothetical protein
MESLHSLLLSTADILQIGTAMMSTSASAEQAHDRDLLEYLHAALATLQASMDKGTPAREWAVDSFADVLDAAWIGMGH